MTKGVVEVEKEDGGRPASAEGSPEGKEHVQRSFDLSTQEGLAAYWAQLAQMSVDYRSAFRLIQSCIHSVMHSSSQIDAKSRFYVSFEQTCSTANPVFRLDSSSSISSVS